MSLAIYNKNLNIQSLLILAKELFIQNFLSKTAEKAAASYNRKKSTPVNHQTSRIYSKGHHPQF